MQTIPEATQERIIAEMHRAMRHLHSLEGVSVLEILVTMHAESVMQIANFFGGVVAADCCDSAAKRVAGVPVNPAFVASAQGVGYRVQ